MNQLFTSVEYWSFSFSISPSNEYSGLISFRKSLSDLKITYWSWIISLPPPPLFFPPSSSSSFPFHSFPVSSWKLSSFQSSLYRLSLMPSESVHALNDGSSLVHWVQSIFPHPTQMSILSSGILPSLPCLGSPPPITISLFPGSSQWLSSQFSWFWPLLLTHPHLSSQYALPSTKSNAVTSLLKTLPSLWDTWASGWWESNLRLFSWLCHIPPSSTYPHPYSRPVEFLTFYYRHLFCYCFYYFAPLYIISPVPGLPLLLGKLLFLHLLRLLDTLYTFFSSICHVILLIWLPSWSISSSLLRAISVSSMIYTIWLINSVHTWKIHVKWIYK